MTKKLPLGHPHYYHPPHDGVSVHYNTQLSSCFCGVLPGPGVAETHVLEDVTCPECLRMKGRSLRLKPGEAKRTELPTFEPGEAE